MPSLVVSYTHDNAAVMQTIEAVDRALAVYAQALESGTSRFLVGRPRALFSGASTMMMNALN